MTDTNSTSPPERSARQGRALPLTFCTVGIVAATVVLVSVTLGAFRIEINHDAQVLLVGTTTAVMFLFGGLIGYWRANDRERAAARREREAEAIGRFAAIAEQITFNQVQLREEVHRALAASEVERKQIADDIADLRKGMELTLRSVSSLVQGKDAILEELRAFHERIAVLDERLAGTDVDMRQCVAYIRNQQARPRPRRKPKSAVNGNVVRLHEEPGTPDLADDARDNVRNLPTMDTRRMLERIAEKIVYPDTPEK